MGEKMIPENVMLLFWDTDPNSLDIYEDKVRIIERIVNKGNFSTIKWLLSTYSLSDIIQVITTNYNISTKALNLWAELLEIPKSTCKCMQRPSQLRVFDL